ncbi:HK97-gp10 family putative phage morphogenesis protein [Streptomyces sp. NPDC057325]|uniref:HK97-gp10 family putative phage morphogenesis protein n=1 Tax=unclassified Streptomyces TaxID=2593676 RepID=UPI00363CE9A8
MARRRGGRSPARVRLQGLERMRRDLDGLAAVVMEGSLAAVEASAEAVQAGTRARVRVRTGNLRDHVGIYYARGGLSAKVGWKDRADWYATQHELGTRRIPAQPALGPAIEEERTKFEDRLRAEITRRLPS